MSTSQHLSSDKARQLVEQITGIAFPAAHHAVSKDGTAVSRAIPFLGVKQANRPTWIFNNDDIDLHLPAATLIRFGRKRRAMEVAIDAQTGQLVTIHVTTHESDPQMYPEPAASHAEKQLRDQGEEYVGFPEHPPAVSFASALNSILAGGIGNPLAAKEIDGLYVLLSENNHKAYPAWIITLRGIPPLPHHGPPGAHVNEWELNHIRNVVDATTGVVRFATSAPQPDVPITPFPE